MADEEEVVVEVFEGVEGAEEVVVVSAAEVAVVADEAASIVFR